MIKANSPEFLSWIETFRSTNSRNFIDFCLATAELFQNTDRYKILKNNTASKPSEESFSRDETMIMLGRLTRTFILM